MHGFGWEPTVDRKSSGELTPDDANGRIRSMAIATFNQEVINGRGSQSKDRQDGKNLF